MSVETKPNKLVKGLVLDTFHTDVDNTVATYALNSQLEDQEGNHFHYGSEVGTTFIKNIPDTHVVVGHINMERNETVLFTTDGTNSTIGILSRNDDMSYQYEIKVDDTKQTKKLGFKKNIYIRGVYRLLNGCDKIIYFVDGINKDRRINLNQLDSYKLPTTVTSAILFVVTTAIIRSTSTLTGDIKIIRVLSPTNIFTQSNVVANLIRAVNFQSNLSSNSLLVSNINFVQKAQASLLATGTTTADLTVGSSVDADAAAFFARVTTAGGTLTTTEQNAVNTLVVQMKADGIWTKMKAIYPMVGASAAACAQNLKSASFTGLFASGATFTSDGYNPNGASFMNTQLIPLNDLQLNSTHVSQYFKVYNINDFAGIGCTDDGFLIKSLYAYWNYTNLGGLFRVNSNSNIYNSPRPNTFTKGLGIISRTAYNSTIFYDRTFAYPNSTTISTGLSSFPISVSGRNIAGNTSSRTTNIISFTTIGDGLTNTDALNLNTSVEAFQTTLSRQAI